MATHPLLATCATGGVVGPQAPRAIGPRALLFRGGGAGASWIRANPDCPLGRQPAARGFCRLRRSLRHAKRQSRCGASPNASWCICTYTWMCVLRATTASSKSLRSCFRPRASAPLADCRARAPEANRARYLCRRARHRRRVHATVALGSARKRSRRRVGSRLAPRIHPEPNSTRGNWLGCLHVRLDLCRISTMTRRRRTWAERLVLNELLAHGPAGSYGYELSQATGLRLAASTLC